MAWEHTRPARVPVGASPTVRVNDTDNVVKAEGANAARRHKHHPRRARSPQRSLYYAR